MLAKIYWETFATSSCSIYAQDIECPLMIEAASVQWVSGQTFGLAFFRVTETEHQRLGQVISELMEG